MDRFQINQDDIASIEKYCAKNKLWYTVCHERDDIKIEFGISDTRFKETHILNQNNYNEVMKLILDQLMGKVVCKAFPPITRDNVLYYMFVEGDANDYDIDYTNWLCYSVTDQCFKWHHIGQSLDTDSNTLVVHSWSDVRGTNSQYISYYLSY